MTGIVGTLFLRRQCREDAAEVLRRFKGKAEESMDRLVEMCK